MRGNISDQDLTDYALNELQPEERLYMESMLAVSEECRHDVYGMIDISQTLEEGFEAEAHHVVSLTLTSEQRERLLDVRMPNRWLQTTAAGLAAAACAAFAVTHPGLWQGRSPAVQVAQQVSTNVSHYVAEAVSTTVSAVSATEGDEGATKLGTFQKLAEDPALKKWFSTDWLAPEFATPQGPWAQPPATWEPPQVLLDMP